MGTAATQVEWGEHRVRLHLHFTAKAAAAAEAQKLKKQAVWDRMHLQGRRGRERVVLSLRATPFPLGKKWSQWGMDFALSIEDRFGKNGRSAAARYLQQQGRAWQPWGAREPGRRHSQCEGQGQGQGQGP